MRTLSPNDMLRIWEHGQRLHPIDRAIGTLAVVMAGASRDNLARLSIGQRDAYLFQVWVHNFGSGIHGVATCSRCEEKLTYTFDLDKVVHPDPSADEPGEHKLISAGYEVRFRLPNSFDMAAVVECSDPAVARDTILERCISSAQKESEEVSIDNLPESVMIELTEMMLSLDPQAEIQLDLLCPACGHKWMETLDIMKFLWAEISARVERLLQEVHTLAWAYGWREQDILAMSPSRRQIYLSMVL